MPLLGVDSLNAIMCGPSHNQPPLLDVPCMGSGAIGAAGASAATTMAQFRQIVLAAAREAVAAGTWAADDLHSFAGLDVLANCHQGLPDDAALPWGGEGWQLFVTPLTQLHGLSLRTCEAVLSKGGHLNGVDSGWQLQPASSIEAANTAMLLLASCVVQPTDASYEFGPAVRRAVVVRALLAAGALHQSARAVAVARQRLLELLPVSQQQQQQPQQQQSSGQHSEPPLAGLCASELQATPAQPHAPPLQPIEVCSALLTGATGVLKMTLEAMQADGRVLAAAVAALADSELLDHMAAAVLAICNAVAGVDGGSSSGTSSDQRFTHIDRADMRGFAMGIATTAESVSSAMKWMEAASAGAALRASWLSRDSGACGRSSGDVSTHSTDSGCVSTAQHAGGRHLRYLRHGWQQQQQQQCATVAGQSVQPWRPTATGTEAAAHASCSGAHAWAAQQLPAFSATGNPVAHPFASSPFADQLRFLEGPMLQTLLCVQLSLAVRALKACGQSTSTTSAGGAGEDRLSWPVGVKAIGCAGSGDLPLPDVLSLCRSATCMMQYQRGVRHAGSTTTVSGATPFRVQPASATDVRTFSWGSVPGLVARAAVECASRLSRLGSAQPFTPQMNGQISGALAVCQDLLRVRRMLIFRESIEATCSTCSNNTMSYVSAYCESLSSSMS